MSLNDLAKLWRDRSPLQCAIILRNLQNKRRVNSYQHNSFHHDTYERDFAQLMENQ